MTGGAKATKFSAGDVVDVLRAFAAAGIDVCVDGGWGVDALLGEQTREHADLDIAVEHKDVPGVREILEGRGYRDVPRDDTRECNFVLGDGEGHEVDVHSYTFDAEGKLVFGLAYPPESLTGKGVIAGYAARCITAEWAVRFHSGYRLKEKDYRDVSALCRRFGIKLPDEYEGFAGARERRVAGEGMGDTKGIKGKK